MGLPATHLIVVAGHASFNDSVNDVPANPADDIHWSLQPFQGGEPRFYLEHIRRSIELVQDDPASLLLMSGGRTHSDTKKWSEASTYKAIAMSFIQQGYSPDIAERLMGRVDIESFARDSFENLQYSIYRYYYLTRTYPQHTTVVGWKFKQDRFDFHRQTLGIPKSAFTYIGCNNPENIEIAISGEAKANEIFHADPWGLSRQLMSKRRARNPFHDRCSYAKKPQIKHS